MSEDVTAFEGWAILELMGHRTRPAYAIEALEARIAVLESDFMQRIVDTINARTAVTGPARDHRCLYCPPDQYERIIAANAKLRSKSHD